MMRRYLILMVSILLVLVIPVAILADTQDKVILPDVTYLVVAESGGEVHSTKVYVKDGLMYFEIAGQLYAMDVLQETLMPILESSPEKVLQIFEVRKMGEELLDGQRTMHYRFYSRKTGLLEQEIWQTLDLPQPLALKIILYGLEGKVISTRGIVDIEFDPDFSHLDLSNVLQFPRGPQGVSLTSEEFKEMIPWYDLSLQPFPGHELTEIDYVATLGSLRFTLTYSTNETQRIQVMIWGERDRLAETHGPSEFGLMLSVRFSEFTLEPAMSSTRTGVMVGFLGPINKSDGNIFLRNVVLHPTLQ